MSGEVDVAGLRALAEGAMPGPWGIGYSGIYAPDNGYDAWQDARMDEGHSLERYEACTACDKSGCDLHTEDYHRSNHVASVKSHHGDTPIGMKLATGVYIAALSPEVTLALLDDLAEMRALNRQLENDVERLTATVARVEALRGRWAERGSLGNEQAARCEQMLRHALTPNEAPAASDPHSETSEGCEGGRTAETRSEGAS